MPAMGKYIQYKPEDKELQIELGRIKSGYFDKTSGDYQTMITMLLEPKAAMDTIFSIQQTILNFNTYAGMSVGFRDILLSAESYKAIQEKKEKMLMDGFQLID